MRRRLNDRRCGATARGRFLARRDRAPQTRGLHGLVVSIAAAMSDEIPPSAFAVGKLPRGITVLSEYGSRRHFRRSRAFTGAAPGAQIVELSASKVVLHPEITAAGAAWAVSGIPQADPEGMATPRFWHHLIRFRHVISGLLGRVDEDVAILIPHRSGCADFPLPVLHGRASLTTV